MTNFGENLKTYREQAGWTQRKLATHLDVTHTTILAWEKGHYLPDVLTAADIADLFNCSINELMGKPRPYDLEHIQQKPIGVIIYEKRKERGLTIEVLTTLTNISKTSISNWEHSRSYPSIDDAATLSDALGCSIDELVGRKVKR